MSCYKKATRNKRDTIYNFLPKEFQNTITVGRLDYNSEGLLILTNNGDLSRHLELPKNNLKEFIRLECLEKLMKKGLKKFIKGIKIHGEKYKPIRCDN